MSTLACLSSWVLVCFIVLVLVPSSCIRKMSWAWMICKNSLLTTTAFMARLSKTKEMGEKYLEATNINLYLVQSARGARVALLACPAVPQGRSNNTAGRASSATQRR